ncbi:hypothetical protein JHK82_038208 [Glycine max]|uniref:Uncharacterized protein n=1 Tax=Glycine max TaxID=3847 RepID=K7M3S1_SOYBN|nr:hypothetical protein JHK85_038958 [Glycine max]KAG5114939.1 hypothetical protein JHK82_038208 [Glycine max]KAH1105072.1 hypothetical protein GYH30_038384 [Glycine max]KAH1105073.1 hypothetical protein GYH30_038384 [Glycine max]KRH23406.1 hypothetical protein GLYMA_13G355100v4 [Glycine max]|eukprot:XP_003543627.2 uncharacterized protein LOC100802625 [Glycine max]
MESNAPVLAEKVWSMVRVLLFMLRKGISKGKLMMDLNMMLKRRGKLAGKAIANLMSHNHNHRGSHKSQLRFSAPREYEFSCSNTPHNLFPTAGKRHRHFFACVHAPPTQDDDVVTVNAMKAVLEMLNNNDVVKVEASPALPGFGRSPIVRQLRVTDSPFPLRDSDHDNDHQVDKAAEEFIKRPQGSKELSIAVHAHLNVLYEKQNN